MNSILAMDRGAPSGGASPIARQPGAVLFSGVFIVHHVDSVASANSTALPGKPVVSLQQEEEVGSPKPTRSAELTMDIVAHLITIKPGERYRICFASGLLLPTGSSASHHHAPDQRAYVSALDCEDYITRNRIVSSHNGVVVGSADGLLFCLQLPAPVSSISSRSSSSSALADDVTDLFHADAEVFVMLTKQLPRHDAH